MIRKAKAVWRGTGRAGTGNLSTDSGVLAQTPYSFRTRFENEKGTNPEELIAAAHAGHTSLAAAIGDVRVTRIEEQMGPGFPAKDFFPEFEVETFAAEIRNRERLDAQTRPIRS